MSYTVTVISTSGSKKTYLCSGLTDQEALIYAGEVVEENAERDDPDASVVIERDGENIGPLATVRDMTRRAI